jgi:hypothetical protein
MAHLFCELKTLTRFLESDWKNRLVPGSAERLMADLEWAGIEIDEGPHLPDSLAGPYIQVNSSKSSLIGCISTENTLISC